MTCALWTLLILHTLTLSHGFFHRKLRIKMIDYVGNDTGEPLFLTPYIESGNISKGRYLASVNVAGIPSYAGFLTVNKTYNSNMYFWYFPATYKTTDPAVVLWLQGGPGVSSLFGLFNENGPYCVKDNQLHLRPSTLGNNHVIYIDNPVGTGFSFTNDLRGYCTDQTQVGEQLHSALVQFLQLFPELQQIKFFIIGESYAGKYIPALAYTIHKKNPTAKIPINLQGMGIGDGWCDPEHQLVYSKYLYQIGLIDWHAAKLFEEYDNKIIGFIQNKQWADAGNTWEILADKMYLATGFDNFYNYLQSEQPNYDEYVSKIQESSVRKSIHVGNLTFNNGAKVYKHLSEDIMKSVAPWISELLEHYRIVFYNGQLDIIVAYPLTVNFLRNLKFSGSEDYKTAVRKIWRRLYSSPDMLGVRGYVKKAGNMTEILLRNVGHMAPADDPEKSGAVFNYVINGFIYPY